MLATEAQHRYQRAADVSLELKEWQSVGDTEIQPERNEPLAFPGVGASAIRVVTQHRTFVFPKSEWPDKLDAAV